MGVLDVVSRRQPVSQREISDPLGLDATDVVGVLDIWRAHAWSSTGGTLRTAATQSS